MKLNGKEVSLNDVARAIEDAMIDIGFNADVEKLDEHSFDVRVASEDKSVVILVSGVVGLGEGC